MDLFLRDKSALVTGSSKGIGLAVAKSLAAEGCHIHLASRTESDLEAAASEIRDIFAVDVIHHVADLSRTQDQASLAANCKDVDILVNNAGAIPRGGIEHLDDAALREGWELKLFGYINLSRYFYRHMKERQSGVIMNVVGGAAHNPTYQYIAGTMANVALQNFTIALGKESQNHGVRVLGVHPSVTETERMVSHHEKQAEIEVGDKSRWREFVPDLPFGRPTTAQEVADLVTFLISDRASYTSGVMVNVTGGM